ncbi:MAG: Gfo/Idh/MocA family protein [Chloroflexota bacterium]
MDTVRVGIAGLGRFGKLHAATLAGLPGVQVAAVCDPDARQVEATIARLGAARGHATLADMLAAGGLDAVFVVTPEQLHGDQAMQVLDRRLPLFLEKPLAATADEGARIAAAAAAAGVPLQIGFVVRFDAQHALLRAEIASGAFGRVVSLRLKRNCTRSWFPDYGERVHTVYETSIHDIDLALWLTGSRCRRVYAVDRNYSGLTFPDACYAMLEFESGAVAMIETSWFVPHGAPANVLAGSWHGTIDAELEVVGTERSARFRLLDTGLAIWREDFTHHPETGLWPEIGGGIAGALREQDRHFIARVRERAGSAIASADDAVEGLRIAEAIVQSAAQSVPVSLD